MFKNAWNWFKNDGYILILGIGAFILILAPYFWNFSGLFAEKQDVWGQFGDYVGGIMNPILSAILLLAVIKELRHSSKTINDAKQDKENEVSQKKRQNTFDLNLIFQSKKLENDFYLFSSTFSEIARNKNYDFELMRIGYGQHLPKYLQTLQSFSQLNSYKKSELLDIELAKSLFTDDFMSLGVSFKELCRNTSKEEWASLLSELAELEEWLIIKETKGN